MRAYTNNWQLALKRKEKKDCEKIKCFSFSFQLNLNMCIIVFGILAGCYRSSQRSPRAIDVMWIYYVRLTADENAPCTSHKEIIKTFPHCLNCILWINTLTGPSFGYKLFFYSHGIGTYFWPSVTELDPGIWRSAVVPDCSVPGDR